MAPTVQPPANIAQALLRERTKIESCIREAVRLSFDIAEYAIGPSVTEVERIVYFFLAGLDFIETNLKDILKPHGVLVTASGIFCHKTPKVRSNPPNGRKACELGDLAILASYNAVGGGNAILTQAKVGFKSGAYPDQEFLYEKAQTFDYVSPSTLKGTRSLIGAEGCLWYWDIQRYGWHWKRDSTIAIQSRTQATFAFETVVALLFCGLFGGGFQPAPVGDGWSKIINDLLSNCVSKAVNEKRIFVRRENRPMRVTENYRRILAGLPTFCLVTGSFAPFLQQFDDKMAQDARNLDEREEEKPVSSRSGTMDIEGTPPINLPEEPMDDDGGVSFVVFQFTEVGRQSVHLVVDS